MSTAHLLSPKDYMQSLVKDIIHAKYRVTIFSHIISYDKSTSGLIDSLCHAAERGVIVEVSGDVFTYGILGGWKVVPHKPNERIRALRTMIRKFKNSGVRYRWIGQFGPFLFAGRTHVKWCVIDDIVYSFGGVNLYAKGLKDVDFMLRCQDEKLADNLIAEQSKIARADRVGKFYKSRQFASKNGQVLIDGGRPGDSIIYRRACNLAKRASDIILVSQYCPTGKIGKILSQKKAQIYFNHSGQAHGLNKTLISFSTFMTGYRSLYERSPYIHAKFMIFTMPNGTKITLTGSHNFVRGGVILGNREIALETSDPTIIGALEAFLEKKIY